MKASLRLNQAFLIIATIFSFQACKPGAPEKQEKMNVLFISIDDLRPAMACYDDPLAITPNMDRLASEGALFTNHYVQAPSCAPSRTSMLTGYRPDEIEVTNHKTHFRDTRPEVLTLPELFKYEGYTTISIGKIFHYKSGYNDSQSWDKEHFLQGAVKGYLLEENRKVKGKAASSECVEVPDTAYQDGMSADLAIEYLQTFKKNKTPFFLGVGFLKPHLPFNAPKKYWDLHDRESFGVIEQRDRPVNSPEIAFHNWQELRGYTDIPKEGPVSADKEKELRHGYYACVSYVDAQIGKLLQTLDELGLRENTIVVFWGDHGYQLGEQNLWCKSTIFELSARSPLIISAPGKRKKGAIIDAFSESVDLYPTIVDLCGLSEPAHLAGISLAPLMEDPEQDWNDMSFTQFVRPYSAAIGASVPMTHMGYSVRTGEWRYTSWFNVESKSFEFPELYRLAADHEISNNLAGQPEYAELEQKFVQALNEYREGSYQKK
jgi:iduronate 2-sulfatase